MKITQNYLKSILSYNALTGEFRWVNATKYHPRLNGHIAGGIGTRYRLIKIDGRKYKAHRLAWLYVYGQWPPPEMDHKDNDPLNNSLRNLRACSRAQNQANKQRRVGKDLPKGVRRNRGKFTARISFCGKQIILGTFVTPTEAADAYFAKAQELYGEFARAA